MIAAKLPDWFVQVFWAGLVAAFLAHSPALRGPLALDDFSQRAMIEGRLVPARSPVNLFDFIDDGNRASLLDRGALPWWSDPRLKTSFFRPIPSVLTWIDYRAFGYGPLGPHIISFLWWGAAIFCAHLLYREVLAPRAARIAVLAFALSPAHTVPLLWLANRDVLTTIVFGSLAIRSYVRWRASGSRVDAATCAALWVATFATGEYAACLLAYPFAAELTWRGVPVQKRLRGMAVWIGPALLYAIAHAALGYGVRGSGFYRNPLEHVGEYVQVAPRAAAVLVASVWFGIDDRWATAVAPTTILTVVASLTAFAAAALSVAARRRPAPQQTASVVWLALGSLLSLVPVLAAPPSSRLVAGAALGSSAGVAAVLDETWSIVARAVRSAASRSELAFIDALPAIAAVVAFGALFVGSPLEARAFTMSAARQEPVFDHHLDYVRTHADEARDTVVVLRATTPPTWLAAPLMLRDLAPARWRVLTQTFGRVVVVRSGAKTLEIVPDAGEPLVDVGPYDPVRTRPLREGEFVEVPGMRVTVVRVGEDGVPIQLRYDFDVDLDSPSFYWITEGQKGFRHVDLPSLGQGVRLLP